MNSISVIIPAYNAGRYLSETLASVHAQTLQPSEIIVVDGGSTDNTAALIEQSGAKYIYEPRRGAAIARNRGLAAATGDFFALLDADDLWTPWKLEVQMQALDADPSLEAVFGHIAHFLSPDLPPEEAATIHCPAEALPARLPTLMLIRRQAFERVGFFTTEMALGDVVEWLSRATAAELHYATVPHVVLRRRLHATNISRSMRDQRGDYLRLLKQKLDRERAAALPRGDGTK